MTEDPMKIHEFFIKRWEAEQPAFLNVLRALPNDQLNYKPHERCTCAGDLAWQLAEEQKQLAEIVGTGRVHFEQKPRPAGVDEIVAAWEKSTEDLRNRLQSLDEKKTEGEASFLVDGKPVWSDNLGNMIWGYLFDMVHHRGQLTSYLRPMGGKVPSIYGPSADDKG
jgi:uncharacterized damage-inducible protein DinB